MGVRALEAAHALLTRPLEPTVTLFAGGALVAEVIAVRTDWLRHHVGPTVASVPASVIAGWTVVSCVTAALAAATL